MEHAEEYFKLATLGKFYTDAAKASGIEALIMGGWHDSNGPHLLSKVANYRIKQGPSVLYNIRYTDGSLSNGTWDSYVAAEAWSNKYYAGSKVIKFVEEV